jgi:N-acetylglucosamine kinase-like BadF-type ATPase
VSPPVDARQPLLAAVEGGPEGFAVRLGTPGGPALAEVRGPGAGPETDGADRTAAQVLALLARAAHAAGVDDPQRLRLAGLGVFVSGCDLDEEADQLTETLAEVVPAREIVVDDAALALLRAGTAHGDGVAVRCGAVTGCAAAREGSRQRFPALGRAGGDWGGAVNVGEEALWWAARARDGRGVPTTLERLAPLALGHPSAASVARALRLGDLPRWRLAEVAPVVLRAASAGDSVAQQLIERQAAELALTAHMALDAVNLVDVPSEVVLGGILVEADTGPLVDGVRARLLPLAPRVVVTAFTGPAVAGAAQLLEEHLAESGRRAARAARAASGRSLPVVRPPA